MAKYTAEEKAAMATRYTSEREKAKMNRDILAGIVKDGLATSVPSARMTIMNQGAYVKDTETEKRLIDAEKAKK